MKHFFFGAAVALSLVFGSFSGFAVLQRDWGPALHLLGLATFFAGLAFCLDRKL